MDPTTLSNKIPQISFTIFYWKFVVSTIILNSLVQEVEAYDPTLPKRHWTGEMWSQFFKIDLSLEKWKFKPYQFAPGPIFQPPPLPTQLHFLWLLINPLGFTRSLQAAGIDLIESVTLLRMSVKILKSLSYQNQINPVSLLTEKVPAASWTAPSLQHSSSADSWIAGGGVPSFFVFFRTRVYE